MAELGEPRGCHLGLECWTDGLVGIKGHSRFVAGPGLEEVYLWEFQWDRGRPDAGGKEW